MSEQFTPTNTELSALVEQFESAVFSQEPVPADSYDSSYFAEGWRGHHNRYDVDTRRRIEDRNPRLIREVFEPERVLDVGCGPGFLMLFLHELGVDVHGVDFAPAAKQLAPAEVRDRVTIGEIDVPHFPEQSFDLVICREVMEHLTVLQARRVVEQICRASSRFAYVTSRYHPAPDSLLEITTDFETDPTHITLMTKELLRCLFILEGFKSRPDLEERMDWARKHRVLVYERRSSALADRVAADPGAA
jgi:SAM-dependent methyltransferase